MGYLLRVTVVFENFVIPREFLDLKGGYFYLMVTDRDRPFSMLNPNFLSMMERMIFIQSKINKIIVNPCAICKF